MDVLAAGGSGARVCAGTWGIGRGGEGEGQHTVTYCDTVLWGVVVYMIFQLAIHVCVDREGVVL